MKDLHRTEDWAPYELDAKVLNADGNTVAVVAGDDDHFLCYCFWLVHHKYHASV
jgi:hypothetical protein